jgi:hypothetical protein
VRFTYFWLVVVPPLDEVPRLDDPRTPPVRVILRAGAGAGARNFQMSRASTLVQKIEILFHPIVESKNQRIKNGVLQTSWIHDRSRDEETR